MIKKAHGLKKMICLSFFLVLAISCFGKNYGTDRSFGLEFSLVGLELGFETGKGDEIHILGEGLYLGLNYEVLEKLNIQLSAKGGETFFSGFSGDFMFASSSLPLYLSLIYEMDKNSSFYISGGGNNWSVIYEMPYISSSIGYKYKLGSFRNFNVLYLGCELQWIRIWQSQMKNDIISANFTLGFGGYRSNFGQ